MSLPLSGIRVLDLSRYLPGPLCTQMLADYGAEVIKVEDPQGGDLGRSLTPMVAGLSALFYTVNRNKQSLTLNLKHPQGQDIFRQLVKDSDVVVEQFRPGVMKRLGLDYSALKEINPGLVYCAISSYGQTGPLSPCAGHEINYLGLSGVMKLTGALQGQPVMPGVQIAGISGGTHHAVIAILMALMHRQNTGLGQFCDVSIMDGTITLLAYALGEWSALGRLPVLGEEFLSGGYACYNVYQCKDDEYMSLAAVEERFWAVFCSRLKLPRFIPEQWNPSFQAEMKAEISRVIRLKDRADWEKAFAGLDICFTPVLNLDEMIHYPQVKARDMIHQVGNVRGSGLDIAVTGLPIKLSASPGQVQLCFPELGEHNQEILGAAGYSEEELKVLKEKGII